MPNTDTASRSFAASLFACCAVGFGCFFSSFLRIPVVPLYATDLGASTAEVGAINAAFMLMAGLLAIPAGLLADRFGRRPVILGGLLVIALSSFLLYLSRTPQQMIGIYVLFGIGLAAYSPSMMSYVADLAPRTHLGRAYGWYTVAANVAMMLGPATGGLLGRVLGLRAVFLVSGGLTLVMAFVALTSLPPLGTAAAARRAVRPALGALLRHRRYRACLLVTLGGCFGFGLFMTFLPLHAAGLGLDAGHVGLLFASQALANALSRIPFGRLSDRVADRSTLIVAGIVGLSAALVLIGASSSLTALFAFAALLGVSMGVGFTALAALVADVVPPELRGLAMGGYNSCIYLGMMASAASMGEFIARAGFPAGFAAGGAATLAAVILFRFLSRRAS